ncbi:hypothetical protein B7P43_G08474 [Cryptotermes secundus]|uniref:Reverse transcriptase domain-containing protein n=1 Tax=Cryptotermes secundus TaxID=105785 RepID=A0A2J7PQF5_9NEOP|nr:hypothetical protein B7P43_G08474 [Cryptotermes secundus]
MLVTKKDCANGPAYIEIGSYKFEAVCSFTYLGSEVNCKNDISDEIKKRVVAANKCLHGLRKHLKSQLIPRKTKTMMYKVLIRSGLSYASETWPLSRSDERLLSIFERVKRLEWAGHIIRASENRTIKKMLNTKPEGNRRVGRPRLRWEEYVWQDIRILGVKNWRNVASNGEEW